MHSPFKKPKSNDLPGKIKELIQLLSNEEDRKLFTNIYKKVTKKTHNHGSPKKNEDGTITKCIDSFEKGADPNILIQLEKLLREQEEYQKYYNYYTEKFLPALKAEITNSKKLKPEKIKEIEGIINGIISKSSDKGNATEPFNKQSFSSEVPNFTNSDMTPQEEDSVGKGVSGVGTPGKYNTLRSSGHNSASAFPTLEQSQLNGSFSQSCVENEDPSTTADAVEVPSDANTSKLSSGNDSDSGIDSPRKSEESSRSPVSSRRSSLTLVTSTSSEESLNSTLSSTEENSNSYKEETEQSEQAVKQKPKMQESGNSSDQRDQVKNGVSPGVTQVADTEIQREENMDPNSQTTQMTGSQAKDSMQPEEKRDRKNAITIVQKLPVNEKKGEDTPLEKQPNNRNLHVALVAGCALSTIGCIVAGAMTSGLIGVGLFAVAAVCAIGVVAELHSNFLSSKLTSISVEPHVNDKELTACSYQSPLIDRQIVKTTNN
ncbi:DUF350 domain-containing protein [Wolbachia endosymbiont of Oedothorax gibbosus]|uniref:DUF350 domain-containing protein n=1 Tax=Wolbachia endosymbiont of Oedothorax gibbosus TaxID=931100 RepID=UPI002024CEE9|nr:DUF350 domain-containing protein [Wolbachia endosymbiont of Oedothorax gibbosus]